MPITPFIETPTLRIPPATTSGSDTALIDRFRQGVEITNDGQRCLGLYKIGAGSAGNALEQAEFGQIVELEPSVTFTDHEGYQGATYMSGGLTQPFPLDEMRAGFEELIDGALEPLTIRTVAVHSSVDFPVDAHAVRGAMQAGNSDLRGATDRVASIRLVFDGATSPFIDAQDTFGDVALPGYVSDVSRRLEAYDDVYRVLTVEAYPSGSTTLLRDTVMEELVMGVTGGIEPMLPLGIVSMPSGYTYDVPLQKLVATGSGAQEITSLKPKTPFPYGTDSIAFGGLTQ